MSSLGNILGGAALLAAGAVLCYLLLWWKERSLKRANTLETQSLLEKARNETENIVREARLTANEEALKVREHIEQSFTARRMERAELERRLSDREGLINSQLERLVESEKTFTEQKSALAQRMEALQNQERELAELTRQMRDQLQKLAGLSEAQVRSEFVKKVEEEALREA